MLNINNIDDREQMKKYYRVSDMINLLDFFPQLSPVKDITIILDEDDYYKNKEYVKKLPYNRVDTLKGRKPILGIENAGLDKDELFLRTLNLVKEKDPFGVMVLFDIDSKPTERYDRYAGISVGVNIYEDVIIEAVSKGFDGREVSKSICTHERYIIPWYDLRKVNIDNFKEYRTFLISNDEYKITRDNRINFLESLGLDKKIFEEYIPVNYQEIPDFIWSDIIKNLLTKLEKEEDILVSCGFNHFAISGHTEGKRFAPWQMFDKSRYTS